MNQHNNNKISIKSELKIRKIFYVVFVSTYLLSLNAFCQNLPRLDVSENHRYLIQKDNSGNEKPFFFLSDTGWEILSRLTRSEVEFYFKVRKQQGFNVILIDSHNEVGEDNKGLQGIDYPNREGFTPFINRDLAFTQEGIVDNYWKYVDWLVKKADEYGLYIAFLPYFGNRCVQKEWEHIINTTPMAYNWGYFLGNRYKNTNNIIWVLGGDFAPWDYYTKEFDPDEYQITIATAEGIADGINDSEKQFDKGKADYTTSLMTYHICEGLSSSAYFHDADFLDFNSIQSGHNKQEIARNYQLVLHDYYKEPVKPTIDLESWYEEIMVRVDGKFEEPRGTDFDIRRNAYRSILAGAFGYTYGNNNVWMFYKTGMNVDHKYNPTSDWDGNEGIYSPGAEQMIWLKKLFETWPYYQCVPTSELVTNHFGSDEVTTHIQSAVAVDSSFAICYIPTGQVFNINLNKISKKIRCWWYNPETGKICGQTGNQVKKNKPFLKLGLKEKAADFQFTSPTNHDWVLIIDHSTKRINSFDEVIY